MVSNWNSAHSRKLAMVIDGDNAQPSLIEHFLAEAGKYGVVTTRRIYGDWTKSEMSGWQDSLHSYAVQPTQQFRYTVGKNATDSALIIDAMDLLHSRTVDGFCIVSSDSDYTRLATRIREQGLFVMGIGRRNTPESFVKGCEIFVYTENLVPEATTNEQSPNQSSHPEWTRMVAQAIEVASQDDGWAHLGNMGHHLRQLHPAFDPRSYGHKQLLPLVRSYPTLFKLKGDSHAAYVRLRS